MIMASRFESITGKEKLVGSRGAEIFANEGVEKTFMDWARGLTEERRLECTITKLDCES